MQLFNAETSHEGHSFHSHNDCTQAKIAFHIYVILNVLAILESFYLMFLFSDNTTKKLKTVFSV